MHSNKSTLPGLIICLEGMSILLAGASFICLEGMSKYLASTLVSLNVSGPLYMYMYPCFI